MNESNSANLNNQAAVKDACALLICLIRFAGESGWKGVFTLADLPSIPTKNWLKSHKLQACLTENLLQPLLCTPAVLCEFGTETLAPVRAVLPHALEDESVEVLWELLSDLKEFRLRLPRRSEVVGWCGAVKSWAPLMDCTAIEFSGVVDGGNLARYIEEAAGGPGSLQQGLLSNLQDVLEDDTCAAQWLNKVLRFLKESEHADELGERHIILDQAGRLNKLADLFRDAGIDEELKDIASGIDLSIREELRDKRLTSLSNVDGKGVKGNHEVVNEIITKLNEMAASGDLSEGFASASTRVFAWIVAHENWDFLSRFPGFSQGEGASDRAIVLLGMKGQHGGNIPLAPVAAWDEDLQPFSELFPPDQILSKWFHEVTPTASVWENLAAQQIVRTEMIVTSKASPPDFPADDPLPRVAEGAKHEARDPVELTDIVHFRGDNGVIRRASRSPRRARLFWRFITEWLVIHDAQGLQTEKASCTCNESHNYFRSKWLLTVVENSWVPLGSDRHTRATAQSLGRLFRENGIPSIPDSEGVDRLLKAIRVSRFELTKESWAVDDQARDNLDNKLMGILEAAEKNPDRLVTAAEFLQLMSEDPDVPEYVRDRVKQKKIVARNQQFGILVECLVRKALEDENFRVEKRGLAPTSQ